MLFYVHVPFCKSRCTYCSFYSQPLEDGAQPASSPMLHHYVDTLLLEIAHYADKFGGTAVQSIFFGGGTPSLLPPKVLEVIIDRIAKHFSLNPKAEITLEANPESLRKRGAAEAIFNTGVNRLSIGVQSLDDATLRMLGRPHRVQDSITALAAARDAGFANVSVDLMWGLPGQGMRQWQQTLKDILRLGPDHISSYGLHLEPGTRLEQDVESGALALPPERDQSIMFLKGAEFLESNGFLHYEISNFARMGYQCRHNMGYWEGAPYLGLGPSSTSTVGQRRWTAPAALGAWTDKVKAGTLDDKAEILTPKTRALELMMLRLRTARGLRLKAYKDMTGRDFIKDHQKFAQAMHENGLARIRNGYLRLTRSGMLVSNSVIANLFERMNETLDDDLAPFSLPEPEIEPLDALAPQPVTFPLASKK